MLQDGLAPDMLALILGDSLLTSISELCSCARVILGQPVSATCLTNQKSFGTGVIKYKW